MLILFPTYKYTHDILLNPCKMALVPIFHTPRNYYQPFYGHEGAMEATHPRFLSPFPTNHYNHHQHDANNGFMANSRIEWREGPEAYFIRSELPGMRRDDVKVTIEDKKLLKISGVRKMEYKENANNYVHVEKSGGKFVTAFVLPQNATVCVDHVKITMENGVLNVTLPKRI